MAERTLVACRILVVEDEYLLAQELKVELERAGAIVLGPAGGVDAALATICAAPRIDGAIIDLNLGGQSADRVADLLVVRGVPFVFTTGYDQSAVPERFAAIARCEKPVDMDAVKTAIGRVIHP